MSLVSPRIISFASSVHEVARDCDCACACSTMLPAKHEIQLSAGAERYLEKNPGLHMFPLDGWFVVSVPLEGVITLLDQNAWEILSSFDRNRRDSLRSKWQGHPDLVSTISELVNLRLLTTTQGHRSSPAHSNDSAVLSVWLHTTNRCNLNCSYCYLPHRDGDMSNRTGRAVIDAAFRSAGKHGFREIKLKYAGGEPLLHLSCIIELHQYAQALAQKSGLGLDGVLLSNGTLLNTQILKTIQASGLRLAISLDGLNKYNDCHRYSVDKRGSFQDAVSGIHLSLDHGLVPDISITISSQNVEGLPELVEWLLRYDLPFSFNFYRENERTTSDAELMLREKKIINGMLAAYEVIKSNLPRRSLLASLADRANFSAPHMRPCSVGDSYMVFDTRGKAFKCQMDMETQITDARVEDPLAAIRADQRGIQNPSVDKKKGCQLCQWRYWCAGGCPLMANRRTGSYMGRSPVCDIYRALYPEVIRIEALRLLKYCVE